MAQIGKLSGATLLEADSSFRELQQALTSLTFLENFEAELVEGVALNGTTEVQITNPFRDGYLPSFYIVVRSDGLCNLQDGDTAWTTNFIYLKNSVAASPTISILFFK